MQQLELHPLCTLFPRLSGADFDALRDDIAANGLRQPIVMHDGMILDGGNRYAACLAAKVKPTFIEFRGGSIGDFVLSANMHRRHLSPSMQAAIVATVQDWTNAHGRGRSAESAHVSTLRDTTKSRAEKSGASVSTQRRADAVAKADPKLAAEVAQGKVKLADAVKEVAPQLSARAPATKPAKPAKNAPTVEQLQAEVESLRGELKEAHDIARDLAHQLESYETASGDVKAAAKELTALKGMLHTVETQRDSYMTKCNEMVKTVTYWKRKAGGAK